MRTAPIPLPLRPGSTSGAPGAAASSSHLPAPGGAPATRGGTAVSAPAGLLDAPTADVLRLVWEGNTPAVVVDSPPGAGKTRLVITVAGQLVTRARLAVAIATQTRDQALDVANRAAAAGLPIALLDGKDAHRPRGLAKNVKHLRGPARLPTTASVVVATAARWVHTTPDRFRPNVLIVDEAYQMTYATLGGLGGLADQLLLVGDPGQIDPVVAAPVHRWSTRPTGPHQPAPLALTAARPQFVTHRQLTRTWRLGPDTTALIQPTFYPELPFTSARPPRHLSMNGAAVAEVASLPLTTYSPDDPALAHAAAARVRQLLADARLATPSDPSTSERPVAAADLAVLAPHNTQVGLVSALLADLPDVLIGTINAAQGLEREAVVVVHPLAGYRETLPFATDPGRLCVALSRHRSHVTVITDAMTPGVLARARTDASGANASRLDLHQDVLGHLQAVAL